MLSVKKAGDLLHELTMIRQRETGESYADAFAAVTAAPENSEIVKAYAERGGQVRGDETHFAEHTTVRAIGETVDRLTKQYMAEHKITDYATAMNSVLALPENVELKERYAFLRAQS